MRLRVQKGDTGRQGRAVTFVEPKQQKELEAIEKHISTTLTPWAPGAQTSAAKARKDTPAPEPAFQAVAIASEAPSADAVLEEAVDVVEAAGFRPGRDRFDFWRR